MMLAVAILTLALFVWLDARSHARRAASHLLAAKVMLAAAREQIALADDKLVRAQYLHQTVKDLLDG